MTLPHLPPIDAALAEASDRYDFVLVPGLSNSGPEHWQTIWQNRHAFWLRIAQSHWNTPDIGAWIDAIRRLLSDQRRPAILVGHSLGALASCCVAADGEYRIAGLMLVAPAEPAKYEAEDYVPMKPLKMPSVVVASRNDPTMQYQRTVHWSGIWNATVADLGEAGHINAEAGFGAWPYGLELLKDLVAAADGVEVGS